MQAWNRTRNTCLAQNVRVADTFWTRFVGLMATRPENFREGDGLWIYPCNGIHMFFMRFAIDAVYLNAKHEVIHLEQNLKPWRLGATKWKAESVLELPLGTVEWSGTQMGDMAEIETKK